MFVVDYPNIHEKVVIGDRILVDYGGLILTVVGFESEHKYISQMDRKSRLSKSGDK